jgi:hypothetical protein
MTPTPMLFVGCFFFRPFGKAGAGLGVLARAVVAIAGSKIHLP